MAPASTFLRASVLAVAAAAATAAFVDFDMAQGLAELQSQTLALPSGPCPTPSSTPLTCWSGTSIVALEPGLMVCNCNNVRAP